MRAWLEAAGVTEGPVFRPLWKGRRLRPARLSDHAVARIAQARALAAGLDPVRKEGDEIDIEIASDRHLVVAHDLRREQALAKLRTLTRPLLPGSCFSRDDANECRE